MKKPIVMFGLGALLTALFGVWLTMDVSNDVEQEQKYAKLVNKVSTMEKLKDLNTLAFEDMKKVELKMPAEELVAMWDVKINYLLSKNLSDADKAHIEKLAELNTVNNFDMENGDRTVFEQKASAWIDYAVGELDWDMDKVREIAYNLYIPEFATGDWKVKNTSTRSAINDVINAPNQAGNCDCLFGINCSIIFCSQAVPCAPTPSGCGLFGIQGCTRFCLRT